MGTPEDSYYRPRTLFGAQFLERTKLPLSDASGQKTETLLGRVVAREFKGHDITFRVEIDGSEYLVHTHNRMAFDLGDAVRVRLLEPAVVLESHEDTAQGHSGLTEQTTGESAS